MSKTKISEYSTTPGNNTDIAGVNIAEGCPPSGINNAIRTLMTHVKEWQNGSSGDATTFASLNVTNTMSANVVTSNVLSSGSASFTSALPVTSGGTGANNAGAARTNLGLGSIATQAANNVAITGGSISGASISGGSIAGITDLAIADGGTGASTAANARTNLGLGSIATQNSNAVAITGGAISTSTLTNNTYTNYTESTVDLGVVGSSSTLSLASGTVLIARLTANTTCTFTMPAAVAGKSFILFVRQAATTGNGNAVFSGVKWSVFGTPTVTATANRMDIFTFVSDGISWFGSFTQGYTL